MYMQAIKKTRVKIRVFSCFEFILVFVLQAAPVAAEHLA